MSLERICSRTVVTISPDATVLEAAKLCIPNKLAGDLGQTLTMLSKTVFIVGL